MNSFAREPNRRTRAENQRREITAVELEKRGFHKMAKAYRNCQNPDTLRGILVCSADESHCQIPVVETCHQWFCPECNWRKTNRLVKRYGKRIRHVSKAYPHYRLRHMVLTIDLCLEDPNAYEQYRKFWKLVSKLFDKLLGRKWHQKGQGYIAGCDFGGEGRKLHFHILFFGRYIDKHRLSGEWENLTGYKITYIQPITPSEENITRALRYCTKVTPHEPEYIPLLVRIIKGTRRIRSRGVFFNFPAVEENHDQVCPQCGSPLEFRPIEKEPPWWEAARPPHPPPLDLIPGNKSPPQPPGYE